MFKFIDPEDVKDIGKGFLARFKPYLIWVLSLGAVAILLLFVVSYIVNFFKLDEKYLGYSLFGRVWASFGGFWVKFKKWFLGIEDPKVLYAQSVAKISAYKEKYPDQAKKIDDMESLVRTAIVLNTPAGSKPAPIDPSKFPPELISIFTSLKTEESNILLQAIMNKVVAYMNLQATIETGSDEDKDFDMFIIDEPTKGGSK